MIVASSDRVAITTHQNLETVLSHLKTKRFEYVFKDQTDTDDLVLVSNGKAFHSISMPFVCKLGPVYKEVGQVTPDSPSLQAKFSGSCQRQLFAMGSCLRLFRSGYLVIKAPTDNKTGK